MSKSKCLGSVQSVGGYAFESDDLKYKITTDNEGNQIATASEGFWNTLSKNLGTTLNTVLDVANKVGSTYTTVTGSTLVNQAQQSQPTIDNDTINQIMNNAINQVRKYGMYVGIGIGAIILITLIYGRKRV